MKKILAFLIITFGMNVCHTEITQVSDIKEVFDALEDADLKSLVIFDVDMVLIQPSDPAFQMANMKRNNHIVKRVMKEVPENKQMIFLSLITTKSSPLLVDERTPLFLETLIKREIPTIALTANLTGTFGNIQSMEKWRLDNLNHLGIDFSQVAPCKSSMIFSNLNSYRDNYSTYMDGILFVNGTNVSKGDAFLSFIENSKFLPNKVFFIDDREDNLISLEHAIEKLNCSIAYQGFHYLGAKEYPSKVISEEDFESSWKKLASEANKLN